MSRKRIIKMDFHARRDSFPENRRFLCILVAVNLFLFTLSPCVNGREFTVKRTINEYKMTVTLSQNPPILGKNNIKIEIKDSLGEPVTDDSAIVNKSAKPNFKVIGPKYGKFVKALTNSIKELNKQSIAELEKNGELELTVEGQQFKIGKEDVEIVSHEIEGWLVESEEGVTVAIDTELNEELIAEGYAREFVNRVQNMRKDAGFDVIDRIVVFIEGNEKLIEYVNKFSNYIANEILADKIQNVTNGKGHKQEWKIGEYDCMITIEKV